MGERAQKVVIRANRIERYWSQWGGQSCPQVLLDGRTGLRADLDQSRREDKWMDPDFAEGGYLVDFDHRTILVHSWDSDLLNSVIDDLKAVWPGWSVEGVNKGVADFQRYVDRRSTVLTP